MGSWGNSGFSQVHCTSMCFSCFYTGTMQTMILYCPYQILDSRQYTFSHSRDAPLLNLNHPYHKSLYLFEIRSKFYSKWSDISMGYITQLKVKFGTLPIKLSSVMQTGIIVQLVKQDGSRKGGFNSQMIIYQLQRVFISNTKSTNFTLD